MAIRHIALALLVAAIWGVAFTVIRIGLDVVPPALLTALRYLFAAFPLLLFIKPPKAPWHIAAAYGVMQGAVMFGLLFYAIAIGMPAGLASLVVQFQVFFTVALATAIDGDKLQRHHLVAGAVALVGIIIIAFAKFGAQTVPLWPLVLTLLAALAWAFANIISRRANQADPVAFIVWSSAAAPLVLLPAVAVFQPGAFTQILNLDGAEIWTLAWTTAVLAIPTTVVAFAIWVWLLRTYAAPVVTPFALLVPVFGFATAALVLGERWSLGIGVGAAFVFAGLAINVWGDRRASAHQAQSD